MIDDKLEAQLRRAEAIIVVGEMVVSRQRALIERLERSNLSTSKAQATLEDMEASLRGFYVNRKELLG